MLKVPVLLFVLGSAPFCVLAGEARTVGPEDSVVTPSVEDGMVTPGMEDGMVTTRVEDGVVNPGMEDGMVTPRVEDGVVNPGLEDEVVTLGSSEKPDKSDLTTLRSTRTKSVTVIHVTDQSTLESTVRTQEENQKTTASNAATKLSDGLITVTLVGTIVAVLLATDFIGGIVFVVV